MTPNNTLKELEERAMDVCPRCRVRHNQRSPKRFTEKTCNTCKELKPISDFRNYACCWRNRCKDCEVIERRKRRDRAWPYLLVVNPGPLAVKGVQPMDAQMISLTNLVNLIFWARYI
jgi:hypothetical protein